MGRPTHEFVGSIAHSLVHCILLVDDFTRPSDSRLIFDNRVLSFRLDLCDVLGRVDASVRGLVLFHSWLIVISGSEVDRSWSWSLDLD